MKENVTRIMDDNSFLNELSCVIEALESKEKENGLEGAENTILQYLKRIFDIAIGKEPLIGKQEDYISIQRVLSDDPNLLMCDRIGDLSYYFSYLFHIYILQDLYLLIVLFLIIYKYFLNKLSSH